MYDGFFYSQNAQYMSPKEIVLKNIFFSIYKGVIAIRNVPFNFTAYLCIYKNVKQINKRLIGLNGHPRTYPIHKLSRSLIYAFYSFGSRQIIIL